MSFVSVSCGGSMRMLFVWWFYWGDEMGPTIETIARVGFEQHWQLWVHSNVMPQPQLPLLHHTVLHNFVRNSNLLTRTIFPKVINKISIIISLVIWFNFYEWYKKQEFSFFFSNCNSGPMQRRKWNLKLPS